MQATLYEESQARLKLSMELDTKESEVIVVMSLSPPKYEDLQTGICSDQCSGSDSLFLFQII